MTNVASLSDVGQIINDVFGLFLGIEVMPGIKLSYVLVVVLSLACVYGLLINDGD